MSKAIELIVAGYVKVKNRRALSDLLAHRRKMLTDLQAITGIDPQNTLERVRQEIAVIETGLDELKPPLGSLPENDWG